MAPKKDTPAQRDECVNYAMEVLWGEFDQYLKDKLVFPRIISHAVARTMAGMVHLVSVGMPHYMKSWDDPIVEGRRPEEWLIPEEPVLPPLDTWARCILPVKKRLPEVPVETPPPPAAVEAAATVAAAAPSVQEDQIQQQQQQQQPGEQPPSPATSATGRKSVIKPVAAAAAEGSKEKERPRRATLTLTGQPVVKPGDAAPAPKLYDRKGSPARRFSEGTVLPPELIQKIKPKRSSTKKSTVGSMAAAAAAAAVPGSGDQNQKKPLNVPRSSISGDTSKANVPARRSSIK